MDTKTELCLQFIDLFKNDKEHDDIYSLAEELLDIRDEPITCVFSSKFQCKRTATTPFGYCTAHFKTRKGTELGHFWNQVLEELDIEESQEEEEVEKTVEPVETPEDEVEEIPQSESTMDESGVAAYVSQHSSEEQVIAEEAIVTDVNEVTEEAVAEEVVEDVNEEVQAVEEVAQEESEDEQELHFIVLDEDDGTFVNEETGIVVNEQFKILGVQSDDGVSWSEELTSSQQKCVDKLLSLIHI